MLAINVKLLLRLQASWYYNRFWSEYVGLSLKFCSF